MTQSVYRELMEHLGGSFKREKAGLLIGPSGEDDLVTHYLPDHSGTGSLASFTIDHEALNAEIRRLREARLSCVGIAHAHPPGITVPSHGDLVYLARLFAHPRNGASMSFLFPIVSNRRLFPYIIDAGDPCRVVPATIILL